MPAHSVDPERLLTRLRHLGQIGRTPAGALTRLALTDGDRDARDAYVGWLTDAGLATEIDAIGNVFGTWNPGGDAGAEAPVMIGSHLDTVVDAGIYDGSSGVLTALAVVEAIRDAGLSAARPITIASFTNEEGVRYTPDMMGSLIHAGGFPLQDALASRGTDGSVLGEELRRIGYAGPMAPGSIRPHAFIELHVEQGPLLFHEGLQVGAVEALQGISWQRVTVHGEANHAGTTPMRLRHDAGYAAARITTFLHDLAERSDGKVVATVGTLRFQPDVINIIPATATLTVDLRSPDAERLTAAEAALTTTLEALAQEVGVTFDVERLVRFEPVTFDARIVSLVEDAAAARGLGCRRMTSGAGHDAQMIARIAPSAMIFVPSEGGISHSPGERTSDDDLVAGANVLLDVVLELAAHR
ncbi:MAG: Zn-dependent hydrolase [Gemmatimonadota bacterium]